MMKKRWSSIFLWGASVLAIFQPLLAPASEVWVSLGAPLLSKIEQELPILERIDNLYGKYLIKVDEDYLNVIAHLKHKQGLGGFVTHETLEEAIHFVSAIEQFDAEQSGPVGPRVPYTVDQSDRINPMLEQVQESQLIFMAKVLADFQNRYYRAQTGVDAVKFLKQEWEKLAQGKSYIRVEEVPHRFQQPSLILTLEGLDPTLADEIIVLGGHIDSTSQGYFASPTMRAPGVDDNASGIAVMSEVARILVANHYRGQRTLKFIAYAGEEAGLLGSKEIAANFKSRGLNVVGVLNLDMTNYKGDVQDIYFISDNTNRNQNDFLGALVDRYLKLRWGLTSCGYGCSDHASWHAQGVVASYAFESSSEKINPDIHTARDLLETTQGRMDHSVKFAKLAIAYAVELAK